MRCEQPVEIPDGPAGAWLDSDWRVAHLEPFGRSIPFFDDERAPPTSYQVDSLLEERAHFMSDRLHLCLGQRLNCQARQLPPVEGFSGAVAELYCADPSIRCGADALYLLVEDAKNSRWVLTPIAPGYHHTAQTQDYDGGSDLQITQARAEPVFGTSRPSLVLTVEAAASQVDYGASDESVRASATSARSFEVVLDPDDLGVRGVFLKTERSRSSDGASDSEETTQRQFQIDYPGGAAVRVVEADEASGAAPQVFDLHQEAPGVDPMSMAGSPSCR